MAARSERSFRLETAVDWRRRPKRVEVDPYSITGLRGQGLAATIATLAKQSRARHRLGARVPKV